MQNSSNQLRKRKHFAKKFLAVVAALLLAFSPMQVIALSDFVDAQTDYEGVYIGSNPTDVESGTEDATDVGADTSTENGTDNPTEDATDNPPENATDEESATDVDDATDEEHTTDEEYPIEEPTDALCGEEDCDCLPLVVSNTGISITPFWTGTYVGVGDDFTISDDITGDILVNGGILRLDANYTIIGTVTIQNSGSFYMSDGEITGAGRGVIVEGGSTFIMYDGHIHGNEAVNPSLGLGLMRHGGGVFVRDAGSTFIMHDGFISGNFAEESGGGVFLADEASFYMHGGIISGNEAHYGGGVSVTRTSSFTMNGSTAQIASNFVEFTGGGVVVAADSSFIMLDGDIRNNYSGLGGFGGGGGVHVDRAEFIMGVYGSTGERPMIRNNESTSDNGGGVVLDSSTMTMYSGTIRNNIGLEGGGIRVSRSSTNESNGHPSSELVMYGGLIYDNNAISGGGVSVVRGAAFEMYGGLIYNNTAINGGGVSVNDNNSYFYMDGGRIEGNTAHHHDFSILSSYGQGGGVYVRSDATFTIDNGIIHNNRAYEAGGGVRTHVNATFIMNNGTISNNTVVLTPIPPHSYGAGNGGGVSIGSAYFFMYGGIISGNIANSGGGIRIADGDFVIDGAEIVNNTATYGGGIYVGTFVGRIVGTDALTTLDVSNSYILNNTAINYGGGIWAVYYSNLTVDSTVVFNNNTANAPHDFGIANRGLSLTVPAINSGGGQGGDPHNIDWATLSLPDTHALNNYDINFRYIPPITKTATQQSAALGDVIDYTIVVTNISDNTVALAQVVDQLSSYVTFVPNSITVIREDDLGNYTASYANNTIIVTIPDFEPAEEVTVTFQVTVTSSPPNDLIINTARLVLDGELVGEDEEEVPYAPESPTNEIAITKTSTPEIAAVGGIATYTITVQNLSDTPATDLLVVDVINQTFLQFNPASLTISGSGASHNFNSNTGELRVYLTEIVPNGIATITFNVTVLPAAEGFTVENIAIVYGASEDDEDGNRRRPERDRDRDRLPVPGAGNPIVIKTSDTSEAEVGDIINYTISVINRGTAPLLDYLVIDALDQNLVQFNPSSLTVTGGVTTSNFNTATGEIRVYIAELAVNDTVTITFSVTVLEAAAGEDIENIAIVYGPPENGGGRRERNRGRNRIPVAPNLTITKTSSPSPAEVGDIVTYTITVENLSRVTARDLLVVDVIDQYLLEFISDSLEVSGANATHHFNATTGELRVYISTLASHSTTTITFDVEILPAAEGLTIENIAILYGAPEDDSSGNRRRPERDRDRDRLPVNPPNPSITKTANSATAQVGDIINYTITVTNADEDNAVYEFVVVDMIDLRFVQFMSANFTVSAANATHTFNTSTGELRVYLPEIGAGETITITVSVMVLQAALGGNVVNIAVLYGPPEDDENGNRRRPEIDRDRESVTIPAPPTQPTNPTNPTDSTDPWLPTDPTDTTPTESTPPSEDPTPSTDDSTPPTTVDPVEPGTPPTNTPQPTDPAPPTPPQTPSEDPDLREQFPDGGGDNPDIPPLPTVPGNDLTLSEDGLFWIELDENGVPLGAWHWDDDEGTWIFDPEVPLGAFTPAAALAEMPQTGLVGFMECRGMMFSVILAIVVTSFVAIKQELKIRARITRR